MAAFHLLLLEVDSEPFDGQREAVEYMSITAAGEATTSSLFCGEVQE